MEGRDSPDSRRDRETGSGSLSPNSLGPAEANQTLASGMGGSLTVRARTPSPRFPEEFAGLCFRIRQRQASAHLSRLSLISISKRPMTTLTQQQPNRDADPNVEFSSFLTLSTAQTSAQASRVCAHNQIPHFRRSSAIQPIDTIANSIAPAFSSLVWPSFDISFIKHGPRLSRLASPLDHRGARNKICLLHAVCAWDGTARGNSSVGFFNVGHPWGNL